MPATPRPSTSSSHPAERPRKRIGDPRGSHRSQRPGGLDEAGPQHPWITDDQKRRILASALRQHRNKGRVVVEDVWRIAERATGRRMAASTVYRLLRENGWTRDRVWVRTASEGGRETLPADAIFVHVELETGRRAPAATTYRHLHALGWAAEPTWSPPDQAP